MWKVVVRGQYGPGQDEWKGGAGISAGAGREAGFGDGYIRGIEAVGGQLALERRAVLFCAPASGWRGRGQKSRSSSRRRRTWCFAARTARPNSLVLNIQPDEGISLSFGAKSPGAQMHIRPVTMDFEYKAGVRRRDRATRTPR